jgi:toxin ParE1/3/4
MKVVLTAKAEDDLIHIADYIARDKPEHAISFIRELRDATLQLGDLHGIYPILSRYENLRLRRRVQGNYLIFFRVHRRQVVVVRILNGAMDLDPLLS